MKLISLVLHTFLIKIPKLKDSVLSPNHMTSNTENILKFTYVVLKFIFCQTHLTLLSESQFQIKCPLWSEGRAGIESKVLSVLTACSSGECTPSHTIMSIKTKKNLF